MQKSWFVKANYGSLLVILVVPSVNIFFLKISNFPALSNDVNMNTIKYYYE